MTCNIHFVKAQSRGDKIKIRDVGRRRICALEVLRRSDEHMKCFGGTTIIITILNIITYPSRGLPSLCGFKLPLRAS